MLSVFSYCLPLFFSANVNCNENQGTNKDILQKLIIRGPRKASFGTRLSASFFAKKERISANH